MPKAVILSSFQKLKAKHERSKGDHQQKSKV